MVLSCLINSWFIFVSYPHFKTEKKHQSFCWKNIFSDKGVMNSVEAVLVKENSESTYNKIYSIYFQMSKVALIARSMFYFGYPVVKGVMLFSAPPGDHWVI